MPFTAYNQPKPMVASAAVLDADAWVLAHGVCDEGLTNLMDGMFRAVRYDLDWGDYRTRRWLDSEDFALWCDACRVDPVALRDHLITAHWQYRTV
jgi:hypothetical protein